VLDDHRGRVPALAQGARWVLLGGLAQVRAHHRGHGVLDDGRPAVARVVEIERPELGRVGRRCSCVPALLGGLVSIERPELGRAVPGPCARRWRRGRAGREHRAAVSPWPRSGSGST
jgi:hypothetical protein